MNHFLITQKESSGDDSFKAKGKKRRVIFMINERVQIGTLSIFLPFKLYMEWSAILIIEFLNCIKNLKILRERKEL